MVAMVAMVTRKKSAAATATKKTTKHKVLKEVKNGAKQKQ
jgi:hypothetical protein